MLIHQISPSLIALDLAEENLYFMSADGLFVCSPFSGASTLLKTQLAIHDAPYPDYKAYVFFIVYNFIRFFFRPR